MRFTAAFIAAMAVLISGSNAAPIDDKCTPAEDELNRFPVVTFTSWITDCGDKTGHTMGMNLVYRKYAGLCLPLPDDIRGLEVQEVTQGCRSKCIPILSRSSPRCCQFD